MIYVTGDLHGDLNRFKGKATRQLKKNDKLIVCGDFGFIWDGCKEERNALDWLGKRPYQILFVEGTHDNLKLLNDYPVVDFQNAQARHITGNCYQLLRGQIYRIEDSDIFTFGGGESADMDMRIPGETWWKEELPTFDEMEFAFENLRNHRNRVDYIITHSPSGKLFRLLHMDSNHINYFDSFLDTISQKVWYKRWFFGCLHIDKAIPPLHHSVYRQIIPLNGHAQ